MCHNKKSCPKVLNINIPTISSEAQQSVNQQIASVILPSQ